MKKILGLSIAAMLIMATVGFGTWAYFSDTETSTGNAVSAGTLDLTIDGGDDPVTILTGLTDKAPGDSGELFATLKNIGSLTGELDISTGTVTNTESTGSSEYEQDVTGGAGVGELGGVAEIALWIDVDKSGTFTDGDIVLTSAGSIVTRAAGSPADLSAYYDIVNNYASQSWGGTSGIKTMANIDEHRFYISWRIPTSADNTIQGDSFSFGVNFILEQAAAD